MRRGRACFDHWCDKSIPARRHRLDEPAVLPSVPQRLSQSRDVVGDVRFFNDCVRPERTHQGGLLDQPAVAHHEIDEEVECLGGQSDRLPVAKQGSLRRIEAEKAEDVAGTLFPGP